MRYLLTEDFIIKERLIYLKNKYSNFRIPDKSKEKKRYFCSFYKKDIDIQLYISTEFHNAEELIKHYISYKTDEYIIDSFQFKLKEDNYIFDALCYPASDTYIKILKSIEYYEMLEDKAVNYIINKYPNIDLRNLLFQDGNLKLGTRSKNKMDAHLLGEEFVSYKIIMSINEYDNILKIIKQTNK